ncbi:MAG: tRNA glutamyl-Q(34) synthetase GluQRS [Pseudomonadales bacterium]|nr:tRNA glutamyl-Q(34) synthetase GluQRS [Pseudomonadales bacterium]
MLTINGYIGRFAPSPTGPLHFGSLVAAIAGYIDARANNGRWLLRIEDLDPPRESSTAAAEIIKQLQTFQLEWDAQPLFQSQRLDAYQAALKQLATADYVYHCHCTRRSVTPVYGGTCRLKQSTIRPAAIRLRAGDKTIHTNDRILGKQSWNLEHDVGDFIIKRKDGRFAYQLAVVIDDHFQQVTQILRGSDLLYSTPRQIQVAACLGIKQVEYAHFPVILGSDGHKLSKQAHARSITNEDPITLLNLALSALGQPLHERSGLAKMLNQAIQSWQLEKIPKVLDIPLASLKSSNRQK